MNGRATTISIIMRCMPMSGRVTTINEMYANEWEVQPLLVL